MLSGLPQKYVCNNCASTKAGDECEDCDGHGCTCPCNTEPSDEGAAAYEESIQFVSCDECKTRGIPATHKFNWPLCEDCIKRIGTTYAKFPHLQPIPPTPKEDAPLQEKEAFRDAIGR